MTSSPRRRGCGLHNPDSSHDHIQCFWLAEVRNFTNIMIGYVSMHWQQSKYQLRANCFMRWMPVLNARCGDSHVRDRTSRWPSCLWHGNRCTWMGWSLCWDGALGPVLLFATCRLGVVSANGSAAFIWGLRCHWVRRWVADRDTGPCIAAVDFAVVLSAVTQLLV